MKIQDRPQLLTAREVAELLRVTNQAVKNWAKKGKIRSIKINSRGDYRFFKTDVMKILKIYE